jgi:hypothetical protein
VDVPTAVTIEPDAIYDDTLLVDLLGVSRQRLARERQAGRLRCRRIGQRTYYLGRWVMDWLIGEEARRAD